MISIYCPLSRLFGFCQYINRVFKGVTNQIVFFKKRFFEYDYKIWSSKY